jgi:protein ImuA
MTAKVGERPAIAALRARIRALEHGGGHGGGCGDGGHGDGLSGAGAASRPVLALGAEALDAGLPGGGLALSGLHEVAGARDEWDDGAATGFCLALLGRVAASRPGPLLWVARRPDLYAPGLLALGLDPGRLVLAHARDDGEALWAMEEGLRAPVAVVGEVAEPDDVAGRRLQLAAEAAGRPCFLLRRRLHAARRTGAANSALSRWRVAALPSSSLTTLSGAAAGWPGRPRWRVELLRCRGAGPRTFVMEWDDAAGDFALVAGLRGGAPAADAAAAARAAG